MAKCAVCEKGAHFGNAVSHSHRRSIRFGILTLSLLELRLTEQQRRCMFALLAYVQAK